ncbi:hypothetical protein DRA67_03415 [Neisseria meningitidis]|nr:hypothetical protein DRA67_03415 [Neisseria meningitidis]
MPPALRKRREEKRREEKRREEKRREEKRREEKVFWGWIHFRLRIRKKERFSLMVQGRIISGLGRCFNTI